MGKLWAYRVTWADGEPVMRRDEVESVTPALVSLVRGAALIDGEESNETFERSDWTQTAAGAHRAAIEAIEDQLLGLQGRIIELWQRREALRGWDPFDVATPAAESDPEFGALSPF